jgi:hypothetical protein
MRKDSHNKTTEVEGLEWNIMKYECFEKKEYFFRFLNRKT